MEKIFNPKKNTWIEILKRPTKEFAEVESTVTQIFSEIEQFGDKAVNNYTKKFDKAELSDLLVSEKEISDASNLVSDNLKEALKVAKANISKFHESQKVVIKPIETTSGVICWQETRAIEKVGLYIPGGSAPLFSSVLMLAIPAKIAGCEEIILCTPPDSKGKINPAILYAADLVGITKIVKAGGIQAIGALTFGTESIAKVDKIFGPGNQFVTTAKQVATKYGVSIDMPAGPSEMLVLADSSAKASFVASDLLSQAEHGGDSQVILVSTDKDLIAETEKEVEKQLAVLSRRDIAQLAIDNSKLIYVEDVDTAIELSNEYAPEHLIIATEDFEKVALKVKNAGSVFLGNYTPESAGDYASGTNHTLPTNGYTKSYSGVNLNAYYKTITFQKISKEGLKNLGSTIEIMAAAEGLDAHKNAVSIRLK
ncbi:MAG: histidinol dehydrogenase [Flavobacteriales bacterium]|nr:histidinol dehydrogenase [Flavobacteriales bacterium]